MAKNNRSKLPFPYVANPDEDATYITIASPRTRDGEPLFTPKETVLLFFAAILVDDLMEGAWTAWTETLSLINNSVETGNLYAEQGSRLANIFATSAAATWLAGDHEFHHIVEEEHKDSQLHAILELKMMECAYFVLKEPRVAHLLQGNGRYSTPEERIQEIETRGIFIDGYGSHSKNREPALFLEIKHGENDDDDRNEYNQNTLSYIDDAGNQRSIEWPEGKNNGRDLTLLPPDVIWFDSKIKNMHLKNINARELKIYFNRGIENCHLHSLKLNSLEFQFQAGADPSQSNIDHTIFSDISATSLNIRSGITLNSCTFEHINVDYWTQHSTGAHAPGAAPITFNDCTLRQFKVTHNEEEDDDTEWDPYDEQPVAAYRENVGAAFGATAYLHNWAFYSSVCHDVDLPRSYLPTKYYFEDTSVANFNFVMPAKDAKHATDKHPAGVPRGTLDVTAVATKPGAANDFGAPEAEKVAPSSKDGATSIVLQSKLTSSAPSTSIGLIPRGHWTNIHLSNTVFNIGGTFDYGDKTCENLTVEGINPKNHEVNRYLPVEWVRFFNGDTSDPKQVEALPGLNAESLDTSTHYLRALLQQVVVPENVEAIANVSKIQQTSTKPQTRLEANKTKGNKP